jgi:hypothetical protein
MAHETSPFRFACPGRASMPRRWSSIVVRIIGRTPNGAIADAITKPVGTLQSALKEARP